MTYHDIEAVDPDYYKNLKWMLEVSEFMFIYCLFLHWLLQRFLFLDENNDTLYAMRFRMMSLKFLT